MQNPLNDSLGKVRKDRNINQLPTVDTRVDKA